MATKLTTPIPQDKIGESFVWREWFQKLSDRAFGNASTLDVPIGPTYGGTGMSTYNTGDIIYSNSTDVLTRLPAPAATSYLTMSGAGVPSWVTRNYGAFHTTTTSAPAANTITTLAFDVTDMSSGVSIGSPTTRIVITTAGNYLFNISLQFSNSGAATDDAIVWLRKNGNDVADSGNYFGVPAKHGTVDGHTIGMVSLLVTAAANDYYEFAWLTLAGTTTVETYPAVTGPPAYPRVPGVILIVTQP